MATVTQAYRFALDPTPGQRGALASHCGAARFTRIGVLKTHESTRKLVRRLEQGSARMLAATVIGVDVGVRHLATLSTGATIANPRALECSPRKLPWLNRQLARRMPDSKHRKATRRRLARVYARAANLRRDALHKLTTTQRAGQVAMKREPGSQPVKST